MPEESDRLLRLARVFELGVTVFEGDTERAVRWFTMPKSRLGGESPLERADTEPGIREVEDMLYTIEFTMAA
jgi:putative toxin-antitoxin system antitoxin component (TIGR02293 family)